MTSLHVIQTVDCRVQPNPTYHREPRQRPCWPRSLGQLHVAHVIQVHLHKKKLGLFSSSNELPVSSFSKEKLDGKQHEIVEQNPKTTREDGERARKGERARARAD